MNTEFTDRLAQKFEKELDERINGLKITTEKDYETPQEAVEELLKNPHNILSRKQLEGILLPKTELQKAVELLCNELNKDPELYYAYQANIAMAFVDECRQDNEEFTGERYEWLHKRANNAAQSFLNNLIRA